MQALVSWEHVGRVNEAARSASKDRLSRAHSPPVVELANRCCVVAAPALFNRGAAQRGAQRRGAAGAVGNTDRAITCWRDPKRSAALLIVRCFPVPLASCAGHTSCLVPNRFFND